VCCRKVHRPFRISPTNEIVPRRATWQGTVPLSKAEASVTPILEHVGMEYLLGDLEADDRPTAKPGSHDQAETSST
jgi:hypothetical protein